MEHKHLPGDIKRAKDLIGGGIPKTFEAKLYVRAVDDGYKGVIEMVLPMSGGCCVRTLEGRVMPTIEEAKQSVFYRTRTD